MATQYCKANGTIRAIGPNVGDHIGYVDGKPEERGCIDQEPLEIVSKFKVDITKTPPIVVKMDN